MIRINHEGKVQFIFDHSSNQQVYLVGDFNNWDEHKHPMQLVGNRWVLKLALEPGEYQFKYLAGKIWYNDYAAHRYLPDGWGGENSVVNVNGIPPKEINP